jgi:hypothetical protein
MARDALNSTLVSSIWLSNPRCVTGPLMVLSCK